MTKLTGLPPTTCVCFQIAFLIRVGVERFRSNDDEIGKNGSEAAQCLDGALALAEIFLRNRYDVQKNVQLARICILCLPDLLGC